VCERCRGIILTALQCFARNVTQNESTAAAKTIVCIFSLHTTFRICTQLATRVRYTTVNLRPTASARDFLPKALLRGFLPRRRLRLHLSFLYSRRVYVILRGISTLMYRVRQATVLYVWPSEAPTTQASMFSARYLPREQRTLENLWELLATTQSSHLRTWRSKASSRCSSALFGSREIVVTTSRGKWTL
jgi:hypothetical protein